MFLTRLSGKFPARLVAGIKVGWFATVFPVGKIGKKQSEGVRFC